MTQVNPDMNFCYSLPNQSDIYWPIQKLSMKINATLVVLHQVITRTHTVQNLVCNKFWNNKRIQSCFTRHSGFIKINAKPS